MKEILLTRFAKYPIAIFTAFILQVLIDLLEECATNMEFIEFIIPHSVVYKGYTISFAANLCLD